MLSDCFNEAVHVGGMDVAQPAIPEYCVTPFVYTKPYNLRVMSHEVLASLVLYGICTVQSVPHCATGIITCGTWRFFLAMDPDWVIQYSTWTCGTFRGLPMPRTNPS